MSRPFEWQALLHSPVGEFTPQAWCVVAPVLLAEFALVLWWAL